MSLNPTPAVEALHEPNPADPRVLLAEWANDNDEWVRFIVSDVISTGRPVADATVDTAYDLFRQEKALDPRTLATVAPLSTQAGKEEKAAPLAITRLSEVSGVNALITGEVIEPHAALTILYGENATGKTGYSRIFKVLADSRTADEILGDIDSDTADSPEAKIEYTLGDKAESLTWTGEQGVAPFTRMSIFDSPSVTFHVDDDLEYVYVPAALALFGHVITAIQKVQAFIDGAITDLNAGASNLLGRFPKEASVYPVIETLGASTDLEALRGKADSSPDVDERLESLRQAVAALQSNTLGPQINLRQREQQILQQASALAGLLQAFDLQAHAEAVTKRTTLQVDYETFRSELFAAASLPAEPDETWSDFIAAGDAYRRHLEALDAHDADRCLYCRQNLDDDARALIGKYSAYLEDKILADLQAVEAELNQQARLLTAVDTGASTAYLNEYADRDDRPAFYEAVATLADSHQRLSDAVRDRATIELDLDAVLDDPAANVQDALSTTSTILENLRSQAANRDTALADKRVELNELIAATELGKSWAVIEARVKNAKEADRLKILRAVLPKLSRSVTALSKTASDQLINQSFDTLFAEECAALRAPALKIQFVGREGKAQRRKVLKGRHRPSKVLSEGEQKVLAMADFLAEARLAGITAPVIFDDPVSSLDHRRIKEVAARVANLSDDNQVIVFTHDIFFATTLLAHFEKSKRCSYFQITDEHGKGKVTHATGPRWDTLSNIKKEINQKIQAAKAQDGEARASLVRTGYDWIRAWCEVFTETELLRGVTQRYQPNVGMTRLAQINTDKLADSIEIVTRVFEDACRYIDGHSQPLPTLGVAPSLTDLENHWKELQDCAKAYNSN